MHVAWALVAARTSSRDDVVFGSVLLGRMSEAVAGRDTLGMFINTLPMRIRVDARDLRDAVRDTHLVLSQLIEHEHAPLALAQRCTGLSSDAPSVCIALQLPPQPARCRRERR